MKVSILTPTLNPPLKFLVECVGSVLRQNYKNIEHIFVDGGSTNGALEKIQAYSEAHPERIRYVSVSGLGVGRALKKAYDISEGEILGWLDADDFYEPGTIEYVVNQFFASRENKFLYGGCNIVNSQSHHIGDFIVSEFDKNIWLNAQHYIIFASTFFLKEVIENCGFVNDLGNDLYFYLNVSKKYHLHRVDRVLSNWRLHDESISLGCSERAIQIRRRRALEDLLLVIRHRGSLKSPRVMKGLIALGLWFEKKYLNRMPMILRTRFKKLKDPILKASSRSM